MRRYFYINLTMSVFVSVFVIALYYAKPDFLEGFEANTYDMRFRLRGAIAPNPDIAIIAIDEKSIEDLGRFPWSRKYHARLVDVLKEAGAKAVIFDIFFPEGETAEADSLFASSLRRAGIASVPLVMKFSKNGAVLRVTENIPEIQSASKELCHINISPDGDGVVRWNELIIRNGDDIYPSLGLVGAKAALAAGGLAVGDDHVLLGSRRIPVSSVIGRSGGRLRMLVNYAGPEGAYKRYSFSDVLNGAVGRRELEGKVFLVGATALGVYDLRVTPFSNNMPGVEVNANAIDNILRGDFMRAGALEAALDMFLIVLLPLVVSTVLFGVRASIAVPFVISLLAGYSYLSHVLFLHGRWVSVVYPMLGAVMSFSTAASLRFFVVERRAREIRAMFSSYVSRKVVDELVRRPGGAKVGGERKTLTVLFVDVRGYTAFGEKHSPEEVVRTLNEFLASMTDVIMEHDGTLDKFLGDGILAFWGAPVEQPGHAELAVRCALGMLPRMEALKKKWLSEGREALDFGIGLNTGEAIVGNIGVEGKKMDYTAIGDAVNIAHRLQMLSRDAHRPVISEALYERVKDSVEADCLGEVAVRGKQATIRIYALNGLRDIV